MAQWFETLMEGILPNLQTKNRDKSVHLLKFDLRVLLFVYHALQSILVLFRLYVIYRDLPLLNNDTDF